MVNELSIYNLLITKDAADPFCKAITGKSGHPYVICPPREGLEEVFMHWGVTG